MKNGRRAKVAILLAAALCLPGTAIAQVRKEQVPDPCATPTPSPSPTETPSPSPLPTPEPSPTPSPTPTEPDPDCPTPSPSPSPKPKPSPDDKDSDKSKNDGSGDSKGGKAEPDDDEELEEPEYLRLEGAYNTDVLMAVEAQLRALGWSADEILPRVYAPFIIGGEANWIDTWGAPRYGPGAVVRTHEGQDVFCDYGDPVLASEEGVVDYGDSGLGGIVARLHRPGGGYWYYAHLSGTNEQEFPAGTTVKQGDVIGFCGNSGNALTTPPHVHFGLYKANGEAKNPMRSLIRWLREARRESLVVLARAQGERIARIDSLTAARMFGDSLVPDLSEVTVNIHSLEVAEQRAALHLVEELLPEADVSGDSGDVFGEEPNASSNAARKESAD
jgi:hypothetical protein